MMVFWLFRKLDARTSITYVMGQSAGAIAGALPLLAWGSMSRSVAFGATLPGKDYAISGVFLGEVVTTFIRVTLLTLFLAFRQVRNFTPVIIPPLYSLMVYWEVPISGTSTNPARSLVPAVVSQEWMGWCTFWAELILGALVAALLCSLLAKRITVAKLYHFGSDRDRIFRRT